MKKSKITQIFEQFGPSFLASNKLNAEQSSVFGLVKMCRTGKLGSHKEKCTACGQTKVHYNSCGNRHCPNCQGMKKERWILEREQDLLPVTYFHGVFTVPSQLRGLFRYNKKLLYSLLFKCVKETLFEFSLDKRQKMEAKPGLITILHTWNQKMQYHPHIHCIIPCGGINEKGEWKTSKGTDDFLFNVQALSSKFKQKLLSLLVVLYKKGQLKVPTKDKFWNNKTAFYRTKSMLYDIDWVVYAKESFGGPQQVIEYLGRYTHKIAISNYRVLKVTRTHVYFKYLDRKAEKTRVEKVTGERFIQRFMQHVLPKRFIKIRHYGFLSSRTKSEDLKRIRKFINAKAPDVIIKLSTRELMIKTNGVDPYLCPKCKKDSMVVVEITPGARGSPGVLIACGKSLKLWIND